MIDMLDVIGKVGRALNQSGMAGAIALVRYSGRQGVFRIGACGCCTMGTRGVVGGHVDCERLAVICPSESGQGRSGASQAD